MPFEIYPSSYVCDCGHQLNFFENTIREMRAHSMRKRSGIGEGTDRHAAIFDKGEWVAIFCPKVGREIPAPGVNLPVEVPMKKPRPRKSRGRAGKSAPFTKRQGQFLAFIHAYSKLNRRPPAEADFAAYFQITAPAVHGMIKALFVAGLISREPGRPRSIQLMIPPASLPVLE